MLWLIILFAILAIIFGAWGFGAAAATAWVGAKVLFWIFLVLFILSLLGGGWGWRRYPPP